MSLNRKSLEHFFRENHKVAIACSGGSDSTFLVHAATKIGADVLPIIVRSRFERYDEIDAAIDFCHSEGLEPAVIDVDILSVQGMSDNGPDRCYICKRKMFEEIVGMANKRGYFVVADGTNASDDREDRPGMRALEELGIRSPLREAGLTKSQIRRLSRSERLSTWNKVSNSCLATRIAPGTPMTEDLLITIGKAEQCLEQMGYSGFRVNTDGKDACIRMPQSMQANAKSREEEIVTALSQLFDKISIDEVTRDG